MLDFIQAIPYQLLDSQSGRSGKGFLSPRQVLEQNRGDCDSKVTLMAAMLVHALSKSGMALASGGKGYGWAVAAGVLAHTLVFVLGLWLL